MQRRIETWRMAMPTPIKILDWKNSICFVLYSNGKKKFVQSNLLPKGLKAVYKENGGIVR